VRDLLDAVQLANVIQRVNAGTESAVKTKYLIFDEGREGEVIEEVGEHFPYVGRAVFSDAFVVKTVDLGNLTGFVIAP